MKKTIMENWKRFLKEEEEKDLIDQPETGEQEGRCASKSCTRIILTPSPEEQKCKELGGYWVDENSTYPVKSACYGGIRYDYSDDPDSREWSGFRNERGWPKDQEAADEMMKRVRSPILFPKEKREEQYLKEVESWQKQCADTNGTWDPKGLRCYYPRRTSVQWSDRCLDAGKVYVTTGDQAFDNGRCVPAPKSIAGPSRKPEPEPRAKAEAPQAIPIAPPNVPPWLREGKKHEEKK